MADIARLGWVSRARVTQIMDILLLAPDIQEENLFVPDAESGRDRSRSGRCGRCARRRSGPTSGSGGAGGVASRD